MTTSNELFDGALDFTMNRIDGTPVNLAEQYDGRVLLIVNVASKCGYTPQYAGLQQLHETYSSRGLSVLGFPANEFGNQEPGTNEEIMDFCESSFGVTFDMFEKVVVKGENICPLYAYLTSDGAAGDGDDVAGGEVKWNFEKFLVAPDGRIMNRFRSNVAPGAPEMIASIETALAASAQPQ